MKFLQNVLLQLFKDQLYFQHIHLRIKEWCAHINRLFADSFILETAHTMSIYITYQGQTWKKRNLTLLNSNQKPLKRRLRQRTKVQPECQ